MNTRNHVRAMTSTALRRAAGALAGALAGLVALAGVAAAQEGVTRQCLIVPADVEWMGTGITVTPREFVCVKGDGLWSHGGQGVEQLYPYYGPEGYGRDAYPADPEEPDPVLHIGALVGKIGPESYRFLIRHQTCFVPKITAELLLAMDDAPGTYGNNDGYLRVQVVKQPATWPLPNRVKMNPEMCAPPK
ncbi:LecA/PA-IL family lectin [Pseudoduganella flava]|nr:LecA/PA-IL family lectin [Pseudoduganella flava]